MKSLTANKISRALTAGSKEKLNFNRHQKVDKRVKIKQEAVKDHLQASGKPDFKKTMERLSL